MEPTFISDIPVWLRITGRKAPVFVDEKEYPLINLDDHLIEEVLDMARAGQSLYYIVGRTKIARTTVSKIKRIYG
jgi:hypothetical protein